MIYRPFGKTGINLSAIGYGTNRLNHNNLHDDDGLENEALLMAKAVNEYGVNYIDCGHTYAMGKGEEIIRRARGLFSKEAHLCVKAMYVEDPQMDDAYRRITTSLEHYGVDKVSFGFLWKVGSYEEFLESSHKGKTFDALIKAQRNGQIDNVCVSLHSSPEDAVRILQSGVFSGCIISCNAINVCSYQKLFEYTRENEIGIITMNSLAGGMIVGISEILNRLQHADTNYTSIQNAFRILYSNSAITCMLSSMQNESELKENCESFVSCRRGKDYSDLTDLHLKDIKYCTRCRYCMKGCPSQIQISDIMYAYSCHALNKMMEGYGNNLETDDDEKEYASRLFNPRFFDYEAIPETQASPCIRCGQCNRICTQSLDVMEVVNNAFELSAKYNFSHEQRKARLERILFQKKYRRIGMMPAGKYTNYVIDSIKRYFGENEFEVVLYDNDRDKWGKEYSGIKCIPLECINDSDLVLVTSYKYGDEIYDQLRGIVDHTTEIEKLHNRATDISWF